MYRHSPVRNQRSKGFKIKHVLQVCLMVAICFWLIFQVKRSHDKKKEFDMKIPLSKTQSSDEMVRFGRKDLKPKLTETDKEVDEHEEQQEHERNEEEEQEHDEEDEIEEEKDDEIDENEEEKSDVEIDREKMDEDKESDEKDETEIRVSSDENDDEDGTMVHNHEAREEHYKADDASSAVTHDAQTLGSENENKNGTLGNPIDNVLVDNGESVKNGQEKGSESMVTSMNATTSIDSRENGPPSSTTETTSDSTRAQNITERAIVSVEQTGNSTIEPSNLTNISDVSESRGSKTEDKRTERLKTEVESNAGEGESKRDEMVERSDPDAVQHDTIGSGDRLEEKEGRTGGGMLPEIEREGGNSEDTAAE